MHAPYCHLWPVWLYNIDPHYLITGTIFEKKKKVNEHKMYDFIFSTNSVRNISHSKKKWAMIRNIYIGINVKYPFSLSEFNETWIFSTIFKESSYQISCKSVQWEPRCSIRSERRTDRHDEANSRCWQFLPKAPKIGTLDEDFGRTPVELNVWNLILNDVPARFQITGNSETNKNYSNKLNLDQTHQLYLIL